MELEAITPFWYLFIFPIPLTPYLILIDFRFVVRKAITGRRKKKKTKSRLKNQSLEHNVKDFMIKWKNWDEEK